MAKLKYSENTLFSYKKYQQSALRHARQAFKEYKDLMLVLEDSITPCTSTQYNFKNNYFILCAFLMLCSAQALSVTKQDKESTIQIEEYEDTDLIADEKVEIQNKTGIIYKPAISSISALGSSEDRSSFFRQDQLKQEKTTDENEKKRMQAIIQKIDICRYEYKPLGKSTQNVSKIIKARIHKALVKAASVWTLEQLQKNDVKVHVVSEEQMKKIVKEDNFSCAFVATQSKHLNIPSNAILINEHHFENWSERKAEQLTTSIANELSHAVIHNSHSMATRVDRKDLYRSMVPWKDDIQKEEFLSAYTSFLNRVEEYKALSSKPVDRLKKAELKKLHAYNLALETYLPQRLGKEAYTALQSGLEFEDKEKGLDGGILAIDNPSDELPSKEMPLERLEYLRRAFFLTLEGKEVLYAFNRERKFGIYNNNADQETADRYSDFESLSPEMRQTFGSELCEQFDKALSAEDYCTRRFWSS